MPLHVLCIGAHPDDNEIAVGGTAALMRRRGDVVRFVSVTNGNKGHFKPEYIEDPSILVARREKEATRAVAVVEAEYQSLDIPDGEVYVTREATEAMVRLIRSFGPRGHGPDLVLLNRPNDYHRDHRYAAQLVLDATYMLTVPMMCPGTPHLSRMPVFAYWFDSFTEPAPFKPEVAVPIDDAMELKIDMVRAHESQFFEWLPYNRGALDQVPGDPAGRQAMVESLCRIRGERIRESCAALLPPETRYAEAFQISEYGARPGREELRRLFPSQG